jgi:hypothetical protein
MKKRRSIKKHFSKKLNYNGSIEDFNERNIYSDLVFSLIEEYQIEDKNAKKFIEINGEEITIKIRWTEEVETPDNEKLEVFAKRAYNNSKYKEHIIYVKSSSTDIPLKRISVSVSDLANDYIVTDNIILLKNKNDDKKLIKEFSFNFLPLFRTEIENILSDFFQVKEEYLMELISDEDVIDLLLSETKLTIMDRYPREFLLNKYEKIHLRNN